MRRPLILALFLGFVASPTLAGETSAVTCTDPVPLTDIQDAQADRPRILVLGDSQISFGAGQVFQEFFGDFAGKCGSRTLAGAQVASIGVRSSSLHSWTARGARGKGVICDVDKKYGVNAGTYGINKPTGRSYVQIGQGAAYQFCKAGRSPLEALFEGGRYQPDLLVMSFLGNATDRWAGNPATAIEDVRATLAQIPASTRCIFMTTAPSYDRATNNRRAQAQEAVAAAFAQVGQRCTFVRGFTEETRTVNEGNAAHFKTNSAGRVTDVHHPNIRAARAFFAQVAPQICRAVRDEMEG